MKFIVFLSVFFSIAFGAFATDKNPAPIAKEFTITGHIDGIKKDAIVQLANGNTKAEITSAKVQTLQGKNIFILKGKMTEPDICLLSVEGAEPFSLYVENAKITIAGSITDNKNWTVTGSKTHNDFVTFNKTFAPLAMDLNENANSINNTMPGVERDSLLNVYQIIQNNIQTEIDHYIEKRKASNVSALVLLATIGFNDNPNTDNSRFKKLHKKVQQSYLGKMLNQQINESLIAAIGTQAIDFTLPDTAGVAVSLSAYRGKYVLLDFWASWCGPCRQENPNVVKAFHRFKEKKFDILGVSLDRPGRKKEWLKAIQTDQLAWTNVSDLKFWESEVAKMYKVGSIPQNFLIDPNGIIIGKNLRGPDLESKLCELLGCN